MVIYPEFIAQHPYFRIKNTVCAAVPVTLSYPSVLSSLCSNSVTFMCLSTAAVSHNTVHVFSCGGSKLSVKIEYTSSYIFGSKHIKALQQLLLSWIKNVMCLLAVVLKTLVPEKCVCFSTEAD